MPHTRLTSARISSGIEVVTSLTLPSRVLLSSVLLAGVLLALVSVPAPASAAIFGVTTPQSTLFPGTVTVEGTKDAGTIVDAGAGSTCDNTDPDRWTCELSLPDGSHTLTVTQTAADLTTAQLTVAVRVLGAPVITTTGLTPGTLNGTGFPGAGVVIKGDVGVSCPDPVLPNGSWSCALGVGTGTYSITATQTWGNVPSEPGGTSSAVSVVVDADPPALPAFLSPAAGSRVTSQPTTFSGTGENGGRVEVFVDSVRVCLSPVINGGWNCPAVLVDGQRVVQAAQWDAAGNPSGLSTGYAITVGAVVVAPAVPVTPPRNPAPAPAPAPAAPLPPVTPAPTAPFLPPPVGGSSGLMPFDTWELPTNYGAAIPSASTTTSNTWLLGLALGLGFALLVALPLRLLVTTVRRKRGYDLREAPEEEPLLGPKLTAALFLVAAVLLAALAGGVQAEARYLRLALAIGLALAALNGVSVLAAKLTGSAFGWSTGIRLAPLLLGIAVVTALVSRFAGIQPPIVVGVVLAVRFGPLVATRGRGVVSLVEVAVLVVLGFAAWLGQSALGPVSGFLPSLASETLSALCIAALGSAMVMLLPVHRMPGRMIWEWSHTAWAVVTLATATVAAVVIAGGSGFPVPWVIGGSLVFAAVCIGTWAWVHFVEPQFVDSVGGPS